VRFDDRSSGGGRDRMSRPPPTKLIFSIIIKNTPT
jgi:hypothetical protein